jgi:cobalt-zinc-cadmium efflux system outer membrane protein
LRKPAHSFFSNSFGNILKNFIQISLAAVVASASYAASDKTASLDALVAEALAHNPEAMVYRAEIGAAKGERRTAGEWHNPEVTTDLGTKLVRDFKGNSNGIGPMWTLSATQTFEYPGRIALRKAIANHQIALAELGLEGFRTGLAARIRSVAFRAALSQTKADAASEISKRLDDLLAVLSQRPAAGVVPQLDLRIIEASGIALKRRPVEARREIQTAIYELNQLRGARIDAPLSLPKLDLSLPAIPTVSRLLVTARGQNYDIRTHVLELEQQGFKVQLALNERWSAVRVGPFAHNERADTNEYQFGIGVTLPLPLWNKNAGKIETAKARAAQAEAALTTTVRGVEQKVADAEFVYRSRREEARKLQISILPQIREAAELSDRNYRAGALPIATYIEVQKQYLDSLDAFSAAQAGAVEARQQLEQLTATRLDDRQIAEPGGQR